MSDSDSDVDAPILSKKVDKIKVEKVKKPRKPMTEKHLEHLKIARVKALEALTIKRKTDAEKKEIRKKENDEIRGEIKLAKLDKAPKVVELDTTVLSLKAELEELKKRLAEPVEKKKQKKIVYESSSDEEVVYVKKEKKQRDIVIKEVIKEVPVNIQPTAPLTGKDYIDRVLFYR